MAFDWFTGMIGYDAARLPLGRIMRLGADGVIEWERDSWESAEGSFSSSVQVTRDIATPAMRSSPFLCFPDALRVSGNPTKFLQGHNVFGPSVEDAGPVLQAMVRAFPDLLRPGGTEADLLPAVHRSRYDVAVHVDLGSDAVVHDWLRSLGSNTRSRHGRALVSGHTVYFGKSSRRWSIKCYCKFCELAEHPPAEDYDALRSWAEGHVRIELTLRRMELRERDTLTEGVVWEFWEKLSVGGAEMVTRSGVLPELDASGACRMALQIWADGGDPGRTLPRASFYRYRRRILDQLNVDISIPRSEQWESMGAAGFDVAFLQERQVTKFPPIGQQKRLFRIA